MDVSSGEGWRDVCSFESPTSVALAAARELQSQGISMPRRVKSSIPVCGSAGEGRCFGVGLEAEQDRLPYQLGEQHFSLPRFFVEAVRVLEENVSTAGVFRKAGSVTRQKNIKAALCSGVPLDVSNIHDVASLLKQYLRELPNPVLHQHLTPVFEECFSRERTEGREDKELALLVCLLLPKAHLECLRVLASLLHTIASDVSSSLMDAGSLAVVMAPNLIRCEAERLTSADTSVLKLHTDIVRALIDNAKLIGLVPPRVAELARELEREGVVTGSVEGGGDIPERFQRKKKYRTASISGLVQSLSNHFRSMGGGGHSSPPHPPTAPPMEGPQEVGGASLPVSRHSRRLSFKRRAGSNEDLLGLSKRPAMAQPSPSHRAVRTPAAGSKRRRNILTRRRHTDQTKQASSRLGRFALPNPFTKPQAVKLNFSAQTDASRVAIPKAVEVDAKEKHVQLLGFANLRSPRQPGSSSGKDLEVLCEGMSGSLSADCLGPEPLPLQPSQRSASVEVLTSSTGPSGEEGALAKDSRRRYSVIEGSATPQKYRSQLLTLCLADDVNKAHKPPSTYVAKKSSSKRMRCEVGVGGEEGGARERAIKITRWASREWVCQEGRDTPGTEVSEPRQEGYGFEWPVHTPSTFSFAQPSGIRVSKSDHHLHLESARLGNDPSVIPPVPPSPISRIPPSASFPLFPLSQPRSKLRKEPTHVTGGEHKVINTPIRPPCHTENQFSFSNPRMLQRGKVTRETPDSNTKEADVVETPFESCCKAPEDNPLDEFQHSSSTAHTSDENCVLVVPAAHTQVPADLNTPPLKLRRSASLVGGYEVDLGVSPLPGAKLDEAFLLTPHIPPCPSPLGIHSPNLLETIQQEIESRHQFSSCTPSLLTEASIKANDSYREAMAGQEDLLPGSLHFDSSLDGSMEQLPEPTQHLITRDTGTLPTRRSMRIVPTLAAPRDEGHNDTRDGTLGSGGDQEKSKSGHEGDSVQAGSPLRPSNVNCAHTNCHGNNASERKPPVIRAKKSPRQKRTSHPSTPHGFVFSLPSPWSGRHRESAIGREMKISKRAQVYVVPPPNPSSPKCSALKPPPGPATPSLPFRPHPQGVKVALQRRQGSLRVANKENGQPTEKGGQRRVHIREWVL